MKRITIAWTIVLVLIVGSLTIYGLSIKDKDINNVMEKQLLEQTEKYLGLYTNEYPKLGQTTKITVEKLKVEGYDPKLGDDCDGYVIIENTNMGFKYHPYVGCPNYQTEGYKKEED